MLSEKRPLWLRALLTAGFCLLCAAWLFLAVVLWGGGRISWGGTALWPKSGVLPILRNLPNDAFLAELPQRFPDGMARNSIPTYLCLLPLPVWAFTLSALLPDTLRRLFPGRKKLLCLYWLLAGLGIAFGLLCMLAGCTTLLRRPLSFSAEQRLARIHMLLVPLSAGLALLGWLLPCAILRLRELHKSKGLLREAGGGALRCGLCLAFAFLETAASCLLLAAVRPFAPEAVRYVASFCTRNASYPSMAFVSLVMAPVMEELAFRGLIQRGLRKNLPAWAAIGVTSVFFGLWHRNTGQFVYTLLFALLMGVVYERTGKLRYTVLAHFLSNLFAVMGYSDSSRALLGKLHVFPWLRKLLLGLPAWAAAPLLLLVVAGIVLLVRLMRAKRAPNESFSEEQ